MQRAKSVDDCLARADAWQDELRRLREILQSAGLVETVKWGSPCYTHRGKNVVSIGVFKSYFGLWFHQGALLRDDAKLLINAQRGKTRALRQWRMHSAKDIEENLVRRYVREAVGHIDAGREIRPGRSRPVTVPDELKNALCRRKGAAAAFRELRIGLQREYAEYIRDAKRDTTRQRRIARILPMIVEGVGLNDRYR